MTSDSHSPSRSGACARFETQLGAWLEHDLDATDASWMAHHRATCAPCGRIVEDLERLVHDAAALPAIGPARDLWTGIAARLDTPVLPLSATTVPGTAAPHTSRPARGRRTVTVRWFALAATLLMAVSSAVTWRVATGRGSVETAPAGTDVIEASEVIDAADPSITYEREIVVLRRIVDERFAELDPATVMELRRNLDIIDQAIRDSRSALASDPRSGVIARQLDRALQAKLDLLRRVALL